MVKLMQKAVNMAAAGTPLAITSVFAQDHLRVRPAIQSIIFWPLPSVSAASGLEHVRGSERNAAAQKRLQEPEHFSQGAIHLPCAGAQHRSSALP